MALLGPSGAGKGTQARLLMEHYDLFDLDTGELLRANLAQNSAVGFLARKYVVRGEFVPNEIVDAIVAEWLWKADPQQGVLFDGFPRTINQAQFLDEFFDDIGRTLDVVVYLDLSDDVVEKRLARRIICQDCQAPYHLVLKPPAEKLICDVCKGILDQRPDDIPEIVRVRLRAFRRGMRGVLDYYRQTGRLVFLDGNLPAAQLNRRIIEAVDARPAQSEHPLGWDQSGAIAVPLHPDGARPDEAEVQQSLDMLLIGGPGSGKGTQASRLCEHYNLPHIASGDLFRENIRRGTALGLLAKTYMERGALVPDEVTEAMVEARLSQADAAPGFILDGFPRNLSQAQSLTEILQGLRRRLDAVFYIRVLDREIINRLSGRRICRKCQTPFHIRFNPPARDGICDRCGGELYQRDDDNPKTVYSRLETFHAQTAPLIQYYRDLGVLVEIDGVGQVAEVTARVMAAAEKLIPEKI